MTQNLLHNGTADYAMGLPINNRISGCGTGQPVGQLGKFSFGEEHINKFVCSELIEETIRSRNVDLVYSRGVAREGIGDIFAREGTPGKNNCPRRKRFQNNYIVVIN